MKANKEGLFFRKYDIFVYIFLTVLCLSLLIGTRNFYGGGESVHIYSNGELIQVMPLNKNAQYKAESGGGYNLVVVENGYAYIKDADCPDGVCKKSGKISRAGQSIICVPHKLKIEIKGKSQSLVNKDGIIFITGGGI